MPLKLNLVNKRFGRLTVLKDSGERRFYNVIWECLCDCGKLKKISAHNLVSARIKSCGCLQIDHARTGKAGLMHGDARRSHRPKLYNIWQAIKQRCFYKKAINYKYYGGRGVKVCPEWRNSYITFKNWAMSHGYQNNLTIDRINNDDNYNPSNCRWITRSENVSISNRRRAKAVMESAGKKPKLLVPRRMN